MSTPVHDHPHTVVGELKHLEEIADKGESGETPFILLGGIAAFLAPVVVLLLSLAFAVYYLA